MILEVQDETGQLKPIDTVKLEKGKFTFTGSAKEPDMHLINIETVQGKIPFILENGDIEIGDYITTSSIPGKGMKQSDDLMHNYTVAKARENVTFSSPTEVKQIACSYHCG